MAAEQTSGNPFYTGSGSVPDRLVGRESEQALIKRSLAAICGEREGDYGPLRGRPPPHLKIVGPRGVGKTALLAWAEDEIKPLDADVVSLAYLPNATSEDVFSAFLRELADIPGLDPLKLATQAYQYVQKALQWQTGQPPLQNFKDIMAVRLQFRPVMLLMDEVMHYDPKMLSQVLQQSQLLSRARWPLALVLAGTPALNVHLKKVDATFINRAENININALNPDATREALGRPFLDRGVIVEGKALDLMASWTDNYPFFTQIVGSKVWEAKKGAAKVDVALVRSVEQAVLDARNLFYSSIYSMIDDDDELLECAMKAVEAIEATTKTLTPRQVRTSIAEGTGLSSKDARNVFDQLLDIGLFWVTGDYDVNAAIPSFFNYFKKAYEREHS